MSTVKDDYTLPNNTPVVTLECQEAFNALTEKEKFYVHYLSQACWIGSLIVLFQTSPESPLIFTLLHKLFSEETIEELKNKITTKLSDEEFKAILVYTSGFFANCGNYKGFGDSKFIPSLPVEKFELFVKESEAYKNSPEEMNLLWIQCKSRLYSIKDGVKILGFPGKGLTTYFSSNYTPDDVQLVNSLMKKNNIQACNNRTLKIESQNLPCYQILLASVEDGIIQSEQCKYDNCEKEYIFEVKKGDYSPLLQKVNENLLKAKEYVSNDNEKNMLDKYVESFKTGSLDEHKNGSRFWIYNKNPIIETYIGFIETYRDPHGSRGEFEGFVAMVNKEMSRKFSVLVDKAEQLLRKLPWPKSFEKDKFLKPDFTSLDVLTFAGSEVPCGINIPNYDEIRQNDGFKNVYLGNVILCNFKDRTSQFLSPEDAKLVTKYALQAFEVQVGLHELLGHGSGKLFHQSKDGKFNFDKDSTFDPLTGKQISSWYEENETYDSVFTTFGSAFEECRAECVGLYLSLFPEVIKIFTDNDEEIENLTYVNWLLLLVSGVEKALEMYQPDTKSWSQAHAQARFAISRVLLEAGDGLLTVTEPVIDDKLLITLNRHKLQSVGASAIKNFLLKLQVYKSTANIKGAKDLFEKYSGFSDIDTHPWLRWRNIVLKHKQPRKLFVQCNTFLKDGDVKLKSYEPMIENFINSWVERFTDTPFLYKTLTSLAEKEQQHFRY